MSDKDAIPPRTIRALSSRPQPDNDSRSWPSPPERATAGSSARRCCANHCPCGTAWRCLSIMPGRRVPSATWPAPAPHPRWDDAAQGIRLALTPCGPSADVLTQTLAQTCNRWRSSLPKVGFSADLLFSASGDSVTRIEKVFSVDLVLIRPAEERSSAAQSKPSNSIRTGERNNARRKTAIRNPRSKLSQAGQTVEERRAGGECAPACWRPPCPQRTCPPSLETKLRAALWRRGLQPRRTAELPSAKHASWSAI